MKLNNFLNPKYIAVIGASSNKEKVGRQIFDNLLVNKNIRAFPINHKDKKIAGKPAYESIELVPIKDFANLLVVIAIPAQFVIDEIKKCVKLGIKNIIIISAGFKEIGKGGALLEEEIKNIAQKNKINILGPNCLGLINGAKKINITFSNYFSNNNFSNKNNIAFLSQSGAVGSSVLDWLGNKNIGLSYFVSLGNKTVLNENDFFEFFYLDNNTDLVVAYLEEISQGERFLEIVSKLSKIKPVAILKSGRTLAGSQMASSHTGSLAGSHEITLSALRRCGAIILEDINEIYNLMRLIKGKLKDQSGNLAVLSNAGGPAVLLADEISEQKITLANFSKITNDKLKKELPQFAHIKNPLDILGDADPVRFKKAIDIILLDKNVSSLLILITPQSMTNIEEISEIIGQAQIKNKNKLIITCLLGGVEVAKGKKILAKYFIPNFDSIKEAVLTLSQVENYLRNRKEIKNYVKNNYQVKDFKLKKLVDRHNQLDYIKSFDVLKKAGMLVVSPKKIDKNNINKIKYPVVIKFVGPDFLHKSDKGAIFLDVKNKKEAQKIVALFNKKINKKEISSANYIIYQPIINKKVELILGCKNDPVFGPVILLGLGGIYAEIYKNAILEIADLDYNRVDKMIKSLPFYKILIGARGQKGINILALKNTILKFSKFVNNNKNYLSEIDINPLFVDEESSLAVDVRIIIKQ